MDLIEQLISDLSKRKNSLTVFNPYRDPDLCHNLELCLRELHRTKPTVLLVGEALGFQGGRLTGLPFSSGHLLRNSDHPFLKKLKPELRLTSEEKENTATIVWEYLGQKSSVPLFWNAFPFHPHPSRLQKKNRAPRKTEIEEGSVYLQQLIEIFQPEQIAGLGRAGTAAAERVLPDQDIRYIRHPSYGGKRDFLSGMDDLLGS